MAKKHDKRRRRRTQAPLSAHKRDRKKLVTPMNALPNVRHTDWVADWLPELIWVGAMLREYEEPGPAWAVLEALEPFVDDPAALDGNISAFALIHEESRADALEALAKPSVPPLPEGLAHALSLYPECPAAWLYSRWSRANTPDIERGVNYLKAVVGENFGSRTVPATRMRLVPIGRLAQHRRISVSQDWIDESYIPKYPGDLSEDQQRAAESEIRAMYGALRSAAGTAGGTEWSRYFWRQSYRISVCEFAPSVAALSSHDEVADEPSPRVQDLRETLMQAADDLARDLSVAQRKVELDLYAPEAAEVKLGLASRQARLMRLLLSDAHLWDASAGAHVLRALVDGLITTTWLLKKNEPDLYLRFRAFGLGRLKLFKLHLEDYLDDHENPSQEQLDFVEALEEEVNSEILEMFTDIDLGGSFAGITIRKMAEEAELEPYYNLAYQPYSSDAHGDWVSLKRSDLEHCRNPLHRFHRVGRFDVGPGRIGIEVLHVAVEVGEKTVTAIFNDLGVDVGDAFACFRDALFVEAPATSA